MTKNDKFPTVLFFMLPERGSYNASFLLARELKENNFHVLYYCPENWCDLIKKQGFDCRIFNIHRLTRETLQNYPVKNKMVQNELRFRIRLYLIKKWSEGLGGFIQDNNIDLVFIDPLMSFFYYGFIKHKVKIISVNTTLASVVSSKYPPVFSGIKIKKKPGFFKRIRYSFEWLKLLSQKLYIIFYINRTIGILLSLFITAKYDCFLSFQKLIKQQDIKCRFSEYSFRVRVPEFVFSPRGFDLPVTSDWTERIYLGASIDLKRNDFSFDWNKIDKQKKIIYCSLGTYTKRYKYARRLFLSVIGSVSLKPDCHLILQYGSIPPEELGKISDNISLFEVLPQMEILQKTSLFITHGGFSSVREALFFGVPMIVFPCWLDQFGNAARIVYHNVGIRGNIKKVTPAMITKYIHQVMNDNSLHGSVKEMQDIFRDPQGLKQGIEFTKQYLKK